MSQIDLYNEKKTQLLESIRKSAAVFNDLKMSSEVAVCEDLYEKLSKDSFKVVIMGSSRSARVHSSMLCSAVAIYFLQKQLLAQR